jgi:cellobiose-specific phosphotransferase system component IIA
MSKSKRPLKKSSAHESHELFIESLRTNPEARKSLARALRQARNGQFIELEKLLRITEEKA